MQLGADPEQLERLAVLHRSMAEHLRSTMRTVAGGWERSRWHGRDAARWWERTEGVLGDVARASLLHVALGRRLDGQAVEQRRASLSPPTTQILALDRAGDGRIVQRVGPQEATTVVVLVPGVGTDLGDATRLRADAVRVWEEVSARPNALGGDVAVVSWLGYDPPDHVVAGIFGGAADDGAVDLAFDIEELRAAGAQRVVLVGHSYGAVTAARAAAIRPPRSPGPDALVLLGSPGLGVEPGALRLDTSQVWSAMARDDPIALLGDITAIHGADPATVGRRLPTSRPGHSSYLADRVLLDALARQVVHRHP